MKRSNKLTTRELDVMGCLVRGMGTNTISQELFIAPASTRNHIQSILVKLEARTRLEAVAVFKGERDHLPEPEPVAPDQRARAVLVFLMERGIPFTDTQAAAICQVFA